jgi:hypothetical protein
MNQRRQFLKLPTNKVNVIATNFILHNVIFMTIVLDESKIFIIQNSGVRSQNM